MKLSVKTILIFSLIICMQSSLTLFLVSGIIKRTNRTDSHSELRQEATDVYEQMMDWKRMMWIKLNSIRNTSALLIRDQGEDFDLYRTIQLVIKTTLENSGIDYYVIQRSDASVYVMRPVDNNYFIFSDFMDFRMDQMNPYLKFVVINETLYLSANCRILSSNDFADIHLLKEINSEFCSTLTYQQKAMIAFLLDEDFAVGTFNRGLLPPAVLSPPEKSEFSVREHQEVKTSDGSYNVLVHTLEGYTDISGSEYSTGVLDLVVVMSNNEYNRRLKVFVNTLYGVSAVTAIFSILLSILLSRTITRPVKLLGGAIKEIRKGNYSASIAPQGDREINHLIQGFNTMARTLDKDREAMDKYIEQITSLRDYNETIIQSLRIGVAIINSDLVIEKCNLQFQLFCGLPERDINETRVAALGTDFFSESIIDALNDIVERRSRGFNRVINTGFEQVFEIRMYPFIHVDRKKSDRSGCVFLLENISKRVMMEERIFQADKLSSLSLLSAGMAHEINNPLSSILTNVQNVIMDQPESENIEELRLIESETMRIARLIRELLDFSSSENNAEVNTDTTATIREILSLIRYYIHRDKKISIDESLSPLPFAKIHPEKFKQIMLNIIQNSVHAIEGVGRIEITNRYIQTDASIQITIKDDGCGIPKEVMDHVFDPFYTSRKNGEGTGLGLSLVYGIVKKFKGRIQVNSTVGAGTIFTITLPAVKDEALEETESEEDEL